MSLFAAFLSLAGATALFAVARIGFLLGWRRPTVARVLGSDLSEAERLHDRDMHIVAMVDGVATWDDMHTKLVTVRVAYDVDDREYRSDVPISVHRGARPDNSLMLWYDPADPRRITASGLGLPVLVLFGVMLLTLVVVIKPA